MYVKTHIYPYVGARWGQGAAARRQKGALDLLDLLFSTSIG